MSSSLRPALGSAILSSVITRALGRVFSFTAARGLFKDSPSVWTCKLPSDSFLALLNFPMAFIADVERKPGFVHVLLITTGSVASVKAPLIVKELLAFDEVSVEVIATKPSLTFFTKQEIAEAGSRVWTDEDEWTESFNIGDPILHIELRRWADVVLVAPCSANTLSKIAHGLCDNLATSVLRALAPTTPTYVFPAMNTLMYEHPLTSEHIRVVRDVVHYNVIGPIGKGLACGDVGLGAMTEWRDIVKIVVQSFRLVRRA